MPKDKILVNISNHPKAEWGEKQKKAAYEHYSEIRDIPHPDIPPDWTTERVLQQAEHILAEVLAVHPAAVHVMGEHTFCFTLVRMLQNKGITCLASTTSRTVEVISDKEVRRLFEFSGFRSYPALK